MQIVYRNNIFLLVSRILVWLRKTGNDGNSCKMSKSAKSLTLYRSSTTSTTACVTLGIFFLLLTFNSSCIKWRSAFLSVFVWFVWVDLRVFIFRCPSFIFFPNGVFHDWSNGPLVYFRVLPQDGKILVSPGSFITTEHKEPTWEGSANICILYVKICGYSALNFF